MNQQVLQEELDFLKQTYINNFLKEYSERFVLKNANFLRLDKLRLCFLQSYNIPTTTHMKPQITT